MSPSFLLENASPAELVGGNAMGAEPSSASSSVDGPVLALLEREWLQTNGLGDFASSTLLLTPTRRYHGLVVARPEGSEKRHVFLSRFEEEIRLEGRVFPLSIASYRSHAPEGVVFAPRGDRFLVRFELAPHPRWTFEIEGGVLVREIVMAPGAPATLLRYTWEGDGEVELALRPLLPTREADSLTFRNDAANMDPVGEVGRHAISFQPYGALPPLTITFDRDFEFDAAPAWFERIDLAAERSRGYPDTEDHLSPGRLRVRFSDSCVVAAGLGGEFEASTDAFEREVQERTRRFEALQTETRRRRRADEGQIRARTRLAFAAEDFFVERGGRLGIDAGFPWFGEWGRDTFLSLPGLTLALGDTERCARVLDESLAFLSNGLLPNIFAIRPEDSHYGSADASLWFARAVELYERESGDRDRVRESWLPALLEIAESYWDGTELGLRADEDGLLLAGGPDLNPTWMDAVTPEGPVTPRHGCAVELNGLWYALLHHLEELLTAGGDRAKKRLWRERRLRLKASFLERFWLEDEGRLADRWSDGELDRSIRPNMVIAAALGRSPLTRARRASVVACAKRELLTPRGLRTLSPRDPGYRGRFEGGPMERDAAYHQGTVWPFLFGFFVEATLRGVGTTRPVRDELRASWCAIVEDLDAGGLGHISEVFDGDAPHRGGGTIAQAWNTAELLRADTLLRRRRP